MPQKFQHNRFGECEFVRIEGVDWIIRCCDSGQIHRISPSQRYDMTWIPESSRTSPVAVAQTVNLGNRRESSSVTQKDGEGVNQLLRALRNGNRPGEMLLRDAVKELAPLPPRPHIPEAKSEPPFDIGVPFTPDANISPPPEATLIPARLLEAESLAIAHPVTAEPSSFSVTDGVQVSEKRRLRKVFESLRNGLSPPIHVDSRPFAVGIDVVQQKVEKLLADVADQGGRTVVLRGAYGQGKTFCLQLLKQLALESGFVVASTEIDAFENQLGRPHFIYRSLMRSLCFPDVGSNGAIGLAQRTRTKLRQILDFRRNELLLATDARSLLEKAIQCRPLAWLLSGLLVSDKPELIGALSCEPGCTAASARFTHRLRGDPRDWPAFTETTQGDFGSHLLSGVGRVARFLGYRGLIVILDEMEKWQDLNWKAQSRAGNLLGGLIWGAGAGVGFRDCRRLIRRCDHPDHLVHSLRCGGYPFSTQDRCHLGVAIATTPRGDEGPEQIWSEYGPLEIIDLPAFTPSKLDEYLRRILPSYCQAHDIQSAMPHALCATANKIWRQRGDGSARTAVTAVMSALDEWHQSLNPKEV